MLGMNLGELFVHRNVANLVINTDYSLMSVLKFSIEALGVSCCCMQRLLCTACVTRFRCVCVCVHVCTCKLIS